MALFGGIDHNACFTTLFTRNMVFFKIRLDLRVYSTLLYDLTAQEGRIDDSQAFDVDFPVAV